MLLSSKAYNDPTRQAHSKELPGGVSVVLRFRNPELDLNLRNVDFGIGSPGFTDNDMYLSAHTFLTFSLGAICK